MNPTRLQRRISFLDQRIRRLTAVSQRYTWYRVLTFCLDLGATSLAWFYLPRIYTWITFLLSFGIFMGVVYFHRRVDRWILVYKIRHDQRTGQLARLELNWEHLPIPETLGSERNSLDIDLDLTGPRSLLTLLDISISKEGSRRLMQWLTHPLPDMNHIQARQGVVRELTKLPRFYERLLLELRLVSKDQLHGEQILRWLQVDVPARRLNWNLAIAFILTTTNLVLFLLNFQGAIPAYWIFSFLISLGYYYSNSGLISEFMEAVVALDREISKLSVAIRHIETYPIGKLHHLASLCAPFQEDKNRPSNYLRRIRWITVGVGLRSNPFLAFFLNIFLPWDYLFAYLIHRMQKSAAQVLPGWLDTLYQLDALCSLGNFASLHPEYSFPIISPGINPVFAAHRIGHPLIPADRRVCNNFNVPTLGEVAIITGSNMSGKSTFIKTIGINLCLAYAGAPVCADELRLQPFRLHSCMRISDSIADGFSYFYAEVKCLRVLLEGLRQTAIEPMLYLVDEIFRGTNNRERLQGSRTYIQALIGLHGVGMIATHDLELAHLAEDHTRVTNYHFQDEVRDDRLSFDFQIRPGASLTTNALKIMAMEGLPVEDNQ